MEFGVPSKRIAKEEKYPNLPVITLLPYEGGSSSRKFEFNSKAYDALGFIEDDINHVAFSFNRSDFADNSIVNANTFSESAVSLKVSKNGKISNKSHYEEIKNRYGVGLEDELELTIIDTGKKYGENTIFSLITLESFQKATDVNDAQQVTEEDISEATSYTDQGEVTQEEDIKEEVSMETYA